MHMASSPKRDGRRTGRSTSSSSSSSNGNRRVREHKDVRDDRVDRRVHSRHVHPHHRQRRPGPQPVGDGSGAEERRLGGDPGHRAEGGLVVPGGEADDLFGRALQHETDHTRGTVFGDRLSTKARKKLAKEHDKLAEDYPEGCPA